MDTDKRDHEKTWLLEGATFGAEEVLVSAALAAEVRRRADCARREPLSSGPDGSIAAAEGAASWPGLGLMAGDLPLAGPGPERFEVPGAGLAEAMAEAARRYDVRLCTPALLPEVRALAETAPPELSVSVGALGSHLGGPGALGEVGRLGARVRGGDGALVSVTGGTGANRAALAMLGSVFPHRLVALPVNAHHSLINAVTGAGLSYVFVEGQRVLAGFEAVLPPSADDVAWSLAQHPSVSAVIVTSPSYEGVVADVAGIARVVHDRDPDRLLVVDQAWGAHLGVSHVTAPSAIAEGADIVCESTHKQGGAPNQAGLVVWREGRVAVAELEAAWRREVTTSPSFPLLAGLDRALRVLHSPAGRAHVRTAAARGRALAAGVRALGLGVLDSDRAGGLAVDPCKVAVDLSACSWPGFEVAAALAARGIVVEKASLSGLVLVVPYDLPDGALPRVLGALAEVVHTDPPRQRGWVPAWPGHAPGRIFGPAPALPMRRRMPLAQAVGRECAELIECYPPGIPVLVPGEDVTDAALSYLLAVRAAGGSVVASDPALTTMVIADRRPAGVTAVKAGGKGHGR